jgi:molybdopterin converting factor small subunit
LTLEERIEVHRAGDKDVGARGGEAMKVSMLGTLGSAMGGVRETQVHISGRCTAREVLDELAATYPGLAEKVLGEDHELCRGISLFVGNRSIRLLDGLSTFLEDGDELVVLPLLCGG